MDEILRVSELDVGYKVSGRKRIVLSNIQAALREGEFACLLGPNGCGKSTLLRTLAGMQDAVTGKVWIGAKSLEDLTPGERARQISVVLTERIQLGNISVYDLVALGRYPHTGWRGRLGARDHAMVRWALAITRSQNLSTRAVGELSDGERQRVMIARALAQAPRLLLLDEPTAFLDLPRRVELIGLLRSLAHQSGLTVLLSTHDLDLALQTADSIWLVTPDGKLVDAVPEDMVLSGHFERAFSTPDLRYDLASGSFRAHRKDGPLILVLGDEPGRIWTVRALERIGFQAMTQVDTATNHIAQIDCNYDGGLWKWQVRVSDNMSCHQTLGTVLETIRANALS